jgi:hypothetical protein
MAFVVVDPQSVATMTLIREGSGGVFVAVGCDSTTATLPGTLAKLVQERGGEPLPSEFNGGERWQADVPVCGVAPFEPAQVRVTWRTATSGDQAWILEMSAELTQSSSHLVVEANPTVQVGGKHLTPDAPWVDVATLAVRCQRKQFKFPKRYEQSLQSLVQFDALGELSVDGQPSMRATVSTP